VALNWKAEGDRLSEADKARLQAAAAQKRAQREADLTARHERRARECEARWEALPQAAADHPYLKAKGVPPYGLRQGGRGELVIPVRDVDGKLWSLQRVSIGADGTGHKTFEKDARKTGGFHFIDPRGEFGQGGAILIAEGYATGASVHQATGRPVVVAFDAGNLSAVAAALRRAYPERPIVLLGDDDRHQSPERNAGRLKAEQAAREVGGHALFPRFTAAEQGPAYTDWNDLHRARGLTAVKRQVEAALTLHKQRADERAARALGQTQDRPRQVRAKEVELSR
jgi:phage/plasmid primase-like uncharacterized protein